MEILNGKISLICVSNRADQLEKQLKKSLEGQAGDLELIFIGNENREFPSAAAALNEGARRATGDILLFSHQDIFIKEKDGVIQIAEAVRQCEKGDIVGTQGVREKSKIYYTNLTSGEEFDPALVQKYPRERIPVSCVDEGLFGMLRSTWEEHPFDEELCDNWHLYCVEQCLNARKNGHNVFVYPLELHHFSNGVISIGYMQGLKRLCNYYQKDFKYIWTTCYKVRTNPIYINSLVKIWVLNRKIRGRSLG